MGASFCLSLSVSIYALFCTLLAKIYIYNRRNERENYFSRCGVYIQRSVSYSCRFGRLFYEYSIMFCVHEYETCAPYNKMHTVCYIYRLLHTSREGCCVCIFALRRSPLISLSLALALLFFFFTCARGRGKQQERIARAPLWLTRWKMSAVALYTCGFIAVNRAARIHCRG